MAEEDVLSSVTINFNDVGVVANLDDGTSVTVSVVDTVTQVALVDVVITVVNALPVDPILGTGDGVLPWSDLTAVEAPLSAPITAGRGKRYAVGVKYPTGHPGTPGLPTAPPAPASVYVVLPLAPTDGYEFFWRDRDSGFSAAYFFRILPHEDADYKIDGYPASDGGIIVDVKDFNHGLVYSSRTHSWNFI